jgi:hypothetical protein
MAAANYDILIEQGATFNLTIRWKDKDGDPIDLTGFDARMQIRKSFASDEIVSLTSDDGITLGGALGTIEINIDADTTEELDIRRGVFDLELINAGVVNRLIQGSVNITPEVTK